MSGFLTQPVLSAQAVVNLKKTRETLGEKAKILAGIMPVVSQRNAIFMENEVNGIHVDEVSSKGLRVWTAPQARNWAWKSRCRLPRRLHLMQTAFT